MVLETKRVTCCHCDCQCGLLVAVENGRLVKIRGNPDHIVSRGYICPRGKAAIEYFYHPARLHRPLKRAGERGQGKWEPISWDQALDEIAARLESVKRDYGAEAVAHARGTFHGPDAGMGVRFFNLFGSPNVIGVGTNCAGPAMEAEALTYGMGPTYWGIPVPGKTKSMVLWGHHRAASGPASWLRFREAQRAGAKLIVVDPRRTEEARKADVWLQVRPGSDGALALGWLNVIVREELYDKSFVSRWTLGFDQLAEQVLAYPPDRVAEITWVPQEKIVQAARLFATQVPNIIYWGLGTAQTGRNAVQAERAKAVLRAITGGLDVEGGTRLGGPPERILTRVDLELNDKLAPEQRARMLGAERFKLHWPGYEMISRAQERIWGRRYTLSTVWGCQAHAPTLWRAILDGKPYPVLALVVNYNNIMGSNANAHLVYQALKSPNLELITVMEQFMTPTAELADYVLPAAHWLEKPSLNTFLGWADWAVAGEAALPLQPEHKSDYDFFRELGLRLGQAEHWPPTMDDLWDMCLEPEGLTFRELMGRKEHWIAPAAKYRRHEELDPAKGKPRGFGTPSGKVELQSTILERLGYNPLPEYLEPAETPYSRPDLAVDYPLVLTTGGTQLFHTHQDHRQIASLRRRVPDPVMEIHPQTAAALGIADGDWVYIETARGKVRQKARLTDGIAPRVVNADRWWYPEEPGEEPSLHGFWIANINICTDDELDHCDPMYGSWPLRGLLCRVSKAPAPELLGDGKDKIGAS